MMGAENTSGNLGLQVFPVRKVYDSKKGKWGKFPAVPKDVSWKDYRATERELELAENVGVVCPEGVVILDLDVHKDAGLLDKVNVLLGGGVDWESALIQNTVSGGAHYAFRVSGFVRQGSDLCGVKGFDTRSAGQGWICTGDGYQDQTLLGLLDALEYPDDLPLLSADQVARINGAEVDSFFGDDACADLESVIGGEKLDGIGIEDIRMYLARLPADDLESHDTWLKPGMATHHQTDGSDEGLKEWIEWSRGSSHFDEQECRTRWKSFAQRDGIRKPTRFDYVIGRAGGKVAIRESLLDGLKAKAKHIETMTDYEKLKKEVIGIGLVELPKDARTMLAKTVLDVWGKSQGLTKSDISSALMPGKRSRGEVVGGASEGAEMLEGSPEWLAGWVYVEQQCEFRNTHLGYSIKREAFNAKYDRMPECHANEMNAHTFALNICQIPTVVNEMYWPGAADHFEYSGLPMVNSYRESGATPDREIDEEGAAAISRMIGHLNWLIEDERERRILLDYMAYVVQNPGCKVNWAILMQGAQGVGKSYWAALMEAVMGHAVNMLDPEALNSRFTDWAYGYRLVVIEEIRISGANRYQIMDRIKPFITNPTIPIEQKGKANRTVPNFASYMMLTNHKDALPVNNGDRRYCAIFCRPQSEEQMYEELGGIDGAADYFNDLFSDLSLYAGAFAKWLRDYEISEDFKPKGRAPKTRAFEVMVDANTREDSDDIIELIEKNQSPVVNDSVIDATHLASLQVFSESGVSNNRALPKRLLELGYEPIRARKIKLKDGTYHRIWVKPGWDTAETRQVIQQYHAGELEEDCFL